MIGLHDLSISSLKIRRGTIALHSPCFLARMRTSLLSKSVFFAFTAFTLLENQGVMVERFCL